MLRQCQGSSKRRWTPLVEGLEVAMDLRWTPVGTAGIVCHIRARYYIKLRVMRRQKTYRVIKYSRKLFLF